MTKTQTKTILHIDDDRTALEGLESALEAKDYQVLFTDDASSALEIASLEPPDLILLEIVREFHDGFDLLEEIRSLQGPASEVPVIVVTRAARSPSGYGRALGLGAIDFLTKPVLTSELIRAVQHPEMLPRPLSARTTRTSSNPI